MSSSEYNPAGSGPHPTLAGNILDPNIKADGQMSQGQGVGGTSEQHIREEGLEHVKKNTDGFGSGSTSGEGYSSTGGLTSSGEGYSSTGGLGSSSGEVLSGGLGSSLGSSEGGLSRGSGGVSGSAYNEAPIDRSYGEGGAAAFGAGTIPSGSQTQATEGSGSQVDRLYSNNQPSLGSDPQYISGSGLRDESNSTSEFPDRSRDIGEDRHEESATQGDIAGGSSVLGRTAGAESNDPQVDTAAGSNKPMDSDVTTGSDPTDSADPTTRDTATSGAGGEEKGDDSEKARKEDNKAAATRENRDAIPTAGGEKLGSRHWGESKIVPDNPKPAQEGAGVSSADGQPTDEVRDNTNKNAGSSTQTGTGTDAQGAEKESFVDKIKDTLHIGHAGDHVAK